MVTQFKIFEKLGIDSTFLKYLNSIIDNLTKNNKYIIYHNFNGKQITILFELIKNSNYDGYIKVLNNQKLIFGVYLTSADSSIIMHELKHLDRMLKRDLKTDFYFNLNHIGRDIINKYKHLLYSNETDDILIKTFYLINPDEFEAYYNEFYFEIIDLLKNVDNDESQKKRIIDNFLNQQEIYNFYKYFYKNGFYLENFFKNITSLNEYINILMIKIDQFHKNSPEYNKYNTTISRLKSIIQLNKNVNINSICFDINNHMNKMIKVGYKKFHRLYILDYK